MNEPSHSSSERRSRAGLAVITAILVVTAAWLVVSLILRLWSAVVPAAIVALGCVVALRTRPTVLAFGVGHTERHWVACRFDQFWGTVAITVDEKPVAHALGLFSLRLEKIYTISVGTAEVHTVQIEKRRPLVLSGARSQGLTAYVDNRLVAQTSTMGRNPR